MLGMRRLLLCMLGMYGWYPPSYRPSYRPSYLSIYRLYALYMVEKAERRQRGGRERVGRESVHKAGADASDEQALSHVMPYPETVYQKVFQLRKRKGRGDVKTKRGRGEPEERQRRGRGQQQDREAEVNNRIATGEAHRCLYESEARGERREARGDSQAKLG